MSASVSIRLAQTRTEFEDAFRLLHRARVEAGLEKAGTADQLWLLKHHALPSTNTIVAVRGGKVVAAACLFGESAYKLPMESHLNLHNFRENLEGRLAELSLPAFHPDFARDENLRLALFHFVACFGASYCHYDGIVTEAPVAWAAEHAAPLQFQRIFEPMNGRQVLFLNARDCGDFRGRISKDFSCEYQFPEKKFFLVAHQSMEPAVLDHLFNHRTRLFASLDDHDLRVLKNIYDWGEFARILPARALNMPEKKSPRFPRFPMNCEGFLVNSRGQRENVQVLDVSREGIKLRASQPLDRGDTYMLTIFVGVNKRSELIARGVWADDAAAISGLEVKSFDKAWAQLIEYLEKDYLKVA